MRMRNMIGSCVAVVLAVTVVAAQQQPAGDDPQSPSQSQSQSRTSTTAGQPQETTIVGCIEAQAGGAPGASEFVLVSAEPGAAGASSSSRPSPTGTSGSTSTRTNAGMRYSLSGTKEHELRTGQRVEVIGKSSSAQNRSTSSGSASTSPTSGPTRDTQPSAGAGDHAAPTPESASGARTDSGRQTATTGSAGANANMAMLEIVSYRVVPGNCNQ